MAQFVENESVSFSIIIPIYKVEDYLRKCVDSVLQQTYGNFEVLLIDDGSPDGCPAICEEYKRKDQRVRIIHKSNGGLVSARNTGVRNARGKYICYIDGDDWAEKRMLEVLWQKITETGEPDMVVYNAFYEYCGRKEPMPCYVKGGYYDKARLKEEIYPYMIYDASLPFFTGKVFPAAWNKAYRRELLLKHYCRDERITIAEDNAFTFECLYYADSVCFCNEALYHYNRCNEGSMISQYNHKFFAKSQLVCRYLHKRLAGREDYLDAQLNVFKGAWIIMAVFHEMRYQKSFRIACKRVKATIGKSRAIWKIDLKGLPFWVKGYIVLLRLRCYPVIGIGTKIFINYRKV